MSQTEIIIAGSGGQGVLFAGTVLAWACIEEGKHTTWFPSYGAEVRGGTANSTVIISDEDIGSPVASNPSVLITLNENSLNRFMPALPKGSTVILNSSLIKKDCVLRKDIKVIPVDATVIADKAGDIRAANMVMLGAYIRQSGELKIESVLEGCKKALEGKAKLVEVNQKALEAGYNITAAQSSGLRT
jgi:2-oxoglutarate ferredoxin oxidoreductase subunit gamma